MARRPLTFSTAHFEIFHQRYWQDASAQVNRARKEVKDLLIPIHDQVREHLRPRGWDLHEHWDEAHKISPHVPYTWGGGTLNIVDMWSRFGKSRAQVRQILRQLMPGVQLDEREEAFTAHIHMTFGINYEGFYTNITFSRPPINWIDLTYLRHRILSTDATLHEFARRLTPLSGLGFSFYYGDDQFSLDQSVSPQSLREFLERIEPARAYFLLRRNYPRDDPGLATDRILDTIVGDFELLYPTFDYAAVRSARQYLDSVR